MKSTLEDFREKLFKAEGQGSEKEAKGINLILEFIENDKGLYDRILANAFKTIKTIQPSILFSDFKIAMVMIEAVVAGALCYLKEEGYLKIKTEEKG